MIEPEVGRLAAERASVEDLERMEQCLVDMETDIDAGGNGSDADAAFHAAIAATTRNELLTRIVELIGSRIREQREALQTTEGARESLREHREILEAIRRGDGEAAYRGTRHHLDTVRRLIDQALSEDR
jgi:GntR family transcriptional repressor for pyruvate dehydrogenase complex